MTVDRTERLVSRMSYCQRAELLRVLQADAKRRGWSGRVSVPSTVSVAAPPVISARIGDQPPITVLLPLFQSRAWQEVWRPGAEFHCYLITSTALRRDVSAALNSPTAKAGTAQVGSLEHRISELRRQEYGSIVRRTSGWKAEPGWQDWELFRKLQLPVTPPKCPVRASTQTMIVTAPIGWGPVEMEAIVNESLALFRVHRFADSDAGRTLCRQQNVDPTTLIRYSRTPHGIRAATELTLVRAQADASRVAGLIAAVIATKVRATAADPAALPWRLLDQWKAPILMSQSAPHPSLDQLRLAGTIDAN